MAKQPHVLSFDEASRASRSRGFRAARNGNAEQRSLRIEKPRFGRGETHAEEIQSSNRANNQHSRATISRDAESRTKNARATRSRGGGSRSAASRTASTRSTTFRSSGARETQPALSLEGLSRTNRTSSQQSRSAAHAANSSISRSQQTYAPAREIGSRTKTSGRASESTARAKHVFAGQNSHHGEFLMGAHAHHSHADNRMQAPSDERSEESEEQRTPSKMTFAQRIQKKRRERRKEKAGKQFSRQFESAPSDASANGPRAALYTGSIGSKQRQAMDMQQGVSESGKPSRGMKRARHREFLHSPRALVLGVAAACIVGACIFMYPTARQYYQAIRYNAQLEAEYEAIQNRNAALQQQVDVLQTDEGVAQRAHELYGWVEQGENSVLVQGVTSNSETASSTYQAVILPNSVPAPETWYSPVLDVVFGFENATNATSE